MYYVFSHLGLVTLSLVPNGSVLDSSYANFQLGGDGKRGLFLLVLVDFFIMKLVSLLCSILVTFLSTILRIIVSEKYKTLFNNNNGENFKCKIKFWQI